MSNNKIHIDEGIIKLLYFKYKTYILPLFIFFLSWFVFFQYVIPQIQNFLTVKDEVTASEQTLAVLTQNYNTVASLDSTKVQQYLDIANHALPQVKDFAGILNAISTAAGESGVSVNDYSFQIGDINNVNQSGGATQTVQLMLTINGDIVKAKQFLTDLSLQLPLSEVVSVSIGGASTTSITANFFFSPLVKPVFSDTTSLPLLSFQQKQVLTKFSTTTTSQPPTPSIKPTISISPTSTPSAGI